MRKHSFSLLHVYPLSMVFSQAEGSLFIAPSSLLSTLCLTLARPLLDPAPSHGFEEASVP